MSTRIEYRGYTIITFPNGHTGIYGADTYSVHEFHSNETYEQRQNVAKRWVDDYRYQRTQDKLARA